MKRPVFMVCFSPLCCTGSSEPVRIETSYASRAARADPSCTGSSEPVRIELQAEAREQAQYEKQRSTILREWMDSSSKPASIVTKTAAAEAFGGGGMVWNPRGYEPKPEAVKAAKEVLRRMHAQTQEHLKSEGVQSVKLYRGVRAPYDYAGSVEAWTESEEIARKFAGESGIILEKEIPAERLLYGHKVPGWKDSKKFGPQQEWMVILKALE